MSTSTPTIRRRVSRPSPLRDLRLGAAARAGRAATVAFPGIAFPEPDGGWRRPLASALSIAAHLSVIGLLFAVAWFATPPEKDEPIPIQLVHVKPPPPPPPPPVAKVEPPPRPIAKVEPPPTPKATPAPTPKPPPPAPAPKALAERRSVNFAPSAQTISPQIVNPSVIAVCCPRPQHRSAAFQKQESDRFALVNPLFDNPLTIKSPPRQPRNGDLFAISRREPRA